MLHFQWPVVIMLLYLSRCRYSRISSPRRKGGMQGVFPMNSRATVSPGRDRDSETPLSPRSGTGAPNPLSRSFLVSQRQHADIANIMTSKQSEACGTWSDSWSPGEVGHDVPYKFRVESADAVEGGRIPIANLDYTSFVGNRFPTLETAENFRYWNSRGFDRLSPRVFPLRLGAWQRVHPALREYIFFLHSLDPTRFTQANLAERYGLKEGTVAKILKHFSVRFWFRTTGISSHKRRQQTKEQRIWEEKEKAFAKAVGYQTIGDECIDSEPEEEEFEGWRSTHDYVRQQEVEVEAMSAFPMPSSREPVPKRLDVDLVVSNGRQYKVINWIDPSDRIPF